MSTGHVRMDGAVPVADLVSIFQPYRKQAEYLASTARNRYFMAGRGSGKSWCLALDAVFQSLVNAGKPGALLGRTEGDLKDNLLIFLQAHFDTFRAATGIELVRRFSSGDQKIELTNGSWIHFRGYENVNKLRKFNLCWAAMDEVNWTNVPHDQILSAIAPTLRVPGPRPGLSLASSPNGLMGFTALFHRKQLESDRNYYVARCTSYDNPHMPLETIEDLKRTLSKDAFDTEVLAKALRPKSVVFHQFRASRHVARFDWRNDSHGHELVIGVDWGLNHAAALAIFVDPQGVWRVVDELAVEPQTRGHFQEQLDKFIKQFKKTPFMIATDRAVPAETSTLRNTWGRLKARVVSCDSRKEQEVRGGIVQVQALLDPADGTPPRLMMSDRLARLTDGKTAPLIPALEAYRYVLNAEGLPTDRPFKDDVNDHMADALRMTVVCGARFRELHAGRVPRLDVPDGWHADRKSQPHRAHF